MIGAVMPASWLHRCCYIVSDLVFCYLAVDAPDPDLDLSSVSDPPNKEARISTGQSSGGAVNVR